MHLKPRNTKLLLPAFSIIMVVLGTQFAGLQLALLRAVTEFQFDASMIGLPATFQFLAICFVPLIFGPISDRVGKKKVIVAFMIVFATGCLITGTCTSAAMFLAGIFIIGSGFSVCECLVTAAITDSFPENGEKYTNYCLSFFSIGAVLSPLFLQALMDNFSASWRVIFIICTFAMAAVIPLILLAPIKPPSILKNTPVTKKTEKSFLLFAFILSVFFYMSIEACFPFFADTIMTHELNSPSLGAYAISLFWAMLGIGRFYFGIVKQIPKNITGVFFLCMTAISICMIFVRFEYVMLVMFALGGFACSCVWPGIINAAISLNRNASGATITYLYVVSGIGGALFPFIIGMLLNNYGLASSFSVLAVFPLIAGIIMLKYSKRISS